MDFFFFFSFFLIFLFPPPLRCSLFYWHYSSVGKETAYSAGDPGSIPGLERSPRYGNGNPLQYSCLENPMDRGAWQATVHGLASARHDLMTKPPPLNLIKLLRFFFFFSFFSVTFFIVVINLCPYIGLLQFWGVFLLFIYLFFLFSFFNFKFFDL